MALHWSAKDGETPNVEGLLRWGSDISDQDDYGRIPMHDVAGGDHLESVKLLLDAGSNPHAKDKSARTPLRCERDNFCSDVVRYLLPHCCTSDLDEKDDQHRSITDWIKIIDVEIDTILKGTDERHRRFADASLERR